MFTSCIWLFW